MFYSNSCSNKDSLFRKLKWKFFHLGHLYYCRLLDKYYYSFFKSLVISLKEKCDKIRNLNLVFKSKLRTRNRENYVISNGTNTRAASKLFFLFLCPGHESKKIFKLLKVLIKKISFFKIQI